MVTNAAGLKLIAVYQADPSSQYGQPQYGQPQYGQPQYAQNSLFAPAQNQYGYAAQAAPQIQYGNQVQSQASNFGVNDLASIFGMNSNDIMTGSTGGLMGNTLENPFMQMAMAPLNVAAPAQSTDPLAALMGGSASQNNPLMQIIQLIMQLLGVQDPSAANKASQSAAAAKTAAAAATPAASTAAKAATTTAAPASTATKELQAKLDAETAKSASLQKQVDEKAQAAKELEVKLQEAKTQVEEKTKTIEANKIEIAAKKEEIADLKDETGVSKQGLQEGLTKLLDKNKDDSVSLNELKQMETAAGADKILNKAEWDGLIEDSKLSQLEKESLQGLVKESETIDTQKFQAQLMQEDADKNNKIAQDEMKNFVEDVAANDSDKEKVNVGDLVAEAKEVSKESTVKETTEETATEKVTTKVTETVDVNTKETTTTVATETSTEVKPLAPETTTASSDSSSASTETAAEETVVEEAPAEEPAAE